MQAENGGAAGTESVGMEYGEAHNILPIGTGGGGQCMPVERFFKFMDFLVSKCVFGAFSGASDERAKFTLKFQYFTA